MVLGSIVLRVHLRRDPRACLLWEADAKAFRVAEIPEPRQHPFRRWRLSAMPPALPCLIKTNVVKPESRKLKHSEGCCLSYERFCFNAMSALLVGYYSECIAE